MSQIPTTLISYQRLWNNGQCACWLNALLAMGMIIKHQLISTQRRACLEGLTPLAQAYFNCVPVFDVNEFRESAEEEVDLAVTERNRARDNLRTLYSTWFNNGNSGPGCFSDPFWMWHSLNEGSGVDLSGHCHWAKTCASDGGGKRKHSFSTAHYRHPLKAVYALWCQKQHPPTQSRRDDSAQA